MDVVGGICENKTVAEVLRHTSIVGIRKELNDVIDLMSELRQTSNLC